MASLPLATAATARSRRIEIPKAFKAIRRRAGTMAGTTVGKWNHLVLNTWFVEIAALIFSTACMAAIAIVLYIYDDTTRPQMPFGLTLNAIVSILATGSKSALICAVAGALGQLKWIWFRKSRKLQDIQRFDDASRGPWGSLTLLGSLNVQTLASIGALVTTLALLFEPFVQQILKYPPISVSTPNQDAIVKKRELFNIGPGMVSWERALYTGLWSYDINFQRSPSCPSDRCQWPPYRYVGLCSNCTDVPNASIGNCSPRAFWDSNADNSTCSLSFGHGQSANMTSQPTGRVSNLYSLTQEVIWPINIVHESRLIYDKIGSVQPLLDIPQPGLVLGHAIIQSNKDPGQAPSSIEILLAEECALTHCAVDYDLSVSEARPSLRPLETHYGSYTSKVLPEFYLFSKPWNRTYVCWQARPGPITYDNVSMPGIPALDQGVLWAWVNRSYNAICDADVQLKHIQNAIVGAHFVECGHPWRSRPDDAMCATRKNTLADVFRGAKFAQQLQPHALSDRLKSVTAALSRLNLDLSNEVVVGNATLPVVHVRVDWAWLALPIALELFGITFLMAAIVVTKFHRMQLWKSSVLPLLFYGLDNVTAEGHNASSDICGMERAARKVAVKLGGTGEEDDLFPPWDYDVSKEERKLRLGKAK